MRINKYLAEHTQLSRRSADAAILAGKVKINGRVAVPGMTIDDKDTVTLDELEITPKSASHTVLLLHKPVGYVCSRNGQGSPTIYELIPERYRRLKPVGRLDKDSSGLLVMTDDGQLAYELTHPKFQKEKVYLVTLKKPLSPQDQQAIEKGVELKDGMSRLSLASVNAPRDWEVHMREGRNRQIRRTFAALGYLVAKLHRTQFGPYQLNDQLNSEGSYQQIIRK